MASATSASTSGPSVGDDLGTPFERLAVVPRPGRPDQVGETRVPPGSGDRLAVRRAPAVHQLAPHPHVADQGLQHRHPGRAPQQRGADRQSGQLLVRVAAGLDGRRPDPHPPAVVRGQPQGVGQVGLAHRRAHQDGVDRAEVRPQVTGRAFGPVAGVPERHLGAQLTRGFDLDRAEAVVDAPVTGGEKNASRPVPDIRQRSSTPLSLHSAETYFTRSKRLGNKRLRDAFRRPGNEAISAFDGEPAVVCTVTGQPGTPTTSHSPKWFRARRKAAPASGRP